MSLSRRCSLGAPLAQALFYLGWLYARGGREQLAYRALSESLKMAEENRHIHFLLMESSVATPILALSSRLGLGAFIEDQIVPRLSTRLQRYYRELTEGDLYPTDVELGRPKRSRSRVSMVPPSSEDNFVTETVRRVEKLTAREMEILRMMALGLPNKTIAAKLFITEKTIKTHANRIYRKLEVMNRLQAVLALQDYDRAQRSRGPTA